MSSEAGGRADKVGNGFERLWVVHHHLIELTAERATSVSIEPPGADERGTAGDQHAQFGIDREAVLGQVDAGQEQPSPVSYGELHVQDCCFSVGVDGPLGYRPVVEAATRRHIGSQCPQGAVFVLVPFAIWCLDH
jgi:hypothetical protein